MASGDDDGTMIIIKDDELCRSTKIVGLAARATTDMQVMEDHRSTR
jgi:ribulose 1,5-bisphosphate carboxylase large subunit-like protein